jgi:protein-disulfide isomerase
MGNIWQKIVGCLLVVGIGIAVYKGLGGGDPSTARRAPTAETSTPPATPVASGALAQVAAPQPEQTFDSMDVTDGDFFLGKADAPITLVEYASLTCPHCADFHANVLPEIKKDYIDTGKARLIYRDFPLDRLALAGSMVAQCSGRDRYFGFLQVLFQSQMQWARAANPIEALAQIARLGGITATEFDACLKNEEQEKGIFQKRLDASNKFKVSSTPTIFINGRKYPGGLTFPQIKAVLDGIAPPNKS